MAFPDSSNLTQLATLKSFLDPQPAGGISSVTVTAGGTGYTTATATISDAKGTGAVLSASVLAGVITGITVTTPGQGYVAPTVVIGGPGANGAASAAIGSDATLTALITRVSNVIVDQCPGITIASTNITETRDGIGNRTMMLRRWPATAVTSVTTDYTQTTVPASVNGSDGWVFDSSQNSVKLIGYGYRFDRAFQNIQLTYTATLVGDTRLGSLEHACLVTCALWWKRRAHVDQASMAAPNGMGTISFTQADLPKEAWSIINQVRQFAPIFA